MNKLKLAACGVDCNECGLYNAGHDLKAAESCVEWFRRQGWIKADGNAEAVQKMEYLISLNQTREGEKS